ncbi:hypothetical protein LZ30DRAFT_730820 [Colletotrichum cereale]|nr:hypothetical protein LZ30DRAFT_730820 [Colletotrichum cereale]
MNWTCVSLSNTHHASSGILTRVRSSLHSSGAPLPLHPSSSAACPLPRCYQTCIFSRPVLHSPPPLHASYIRTRYP